jgi:transcriptional regulator with XRE-family HTH domain
MNDIQNITDERFLHVLGERLARIRLAKNLTQEELAERAGLGIRTIQRLELGKAATQLSGFVRVCRALDLLAALDAMIPEQTVSPIEQLKLHGRRRRRASGRKMTMREPKKWTWGESP